MNREIKIFLFRDKKSSFLKYPKSQTKEIGRVADEII